MSYWDEVKNELFRFKKLGEEVSELGATLIGHAPHIAPKAWLHSLFPVLSEHEVIEFGKAAQKRVPSVYADFLMNCSNGLKIFVSTFSLYGLRKQIGRSVEAGRQPYSPDTANVDERPANAKDSYFFIDGYNWDGSHLYIDTETSQVNYCSVSNAKSLYKWESFDEMLISEVKRICGLFDENGVVIDPKQYTTPIPRKMR